MPTKRDYYEVLGLTKSATEAEIKSAYRKMALKAHPDRNKAADAEEKFKEINEAYQILSDKQKRATYDQFGHAAFDPASGMGGGAGGGNPFSGGFGGGPFQWSYNSSGGASNMDFNDPFDIFESIFGAAGFGGGGQRRPRYGLQVTFMEAAKGVTKEVMVEGKKQTIKVPAGANDGTRLRFDNFDVTIDVAADAKFKRDGYDVFVDQEISFAIAALGGQIEVPTLDGALKMKVRAGTQSHTLVRLRGEGIQHLQARGKGDLYVRLIVAVPQTLTREQKQLLEQLKNLGS